MGLKKADATKIRKALDSVNWERLFDKKNVNAQVLKLNETTLFFEIMCPASTSQLMTKILCG